MRDAVRALDDGAVEWAEREARRLLRPLGRRWLHVQAVAARSRDVAPALKEAERRVLVAGAWLHDVGYAPALFETGFHPIDGARWLRRQGHERLARLVAYHSGAVHEARLRGLAREIAEFDMERSPTADALDFCDATTGPSGEAVSAEERWAEIGVRYGSGHVAILALELARGPLAGAVSRTEARLARLARLAI